MICLVERIKQPFKLQHRLARCFALNCGFFVKFVFIVPIAPPVSFQSYAFYLTVR